MEEDDKGCPMIRLGVSGCVFLLVPAYLGCPGQKPLNGCVCVPGPGSFTNTMPQLSGRHGNPEDLNLPMQRPNRVAKRHIETSSRHSTSAKQSRPAQMRAVLCSSSAFTHLRSARNPAKIRPAVLVIPSTRSHKRPTDVTGAPKWGGLGRLGITQGCVTAADSHKILLAVLVTP